jgi:hypothetical protein
MVTAALGVNGAKGRRYEQRLTCRRRALDRADDQAIHRKGRCVTHSITSSARASSVGGISRPSAFVLRLIT